MRRRLKSLAVAALVVTAVLLPTGDAAAAAGSSVSIHWLTNAAATGRVTVEVRQLPRSFFRNEEDDPDRWAQLLSVHAGQGSLQADLHVPPMLGHYRGSADEGVLRFEPAYPLEPGVVYRATLRIEGLDARQRTSVFSLATPDWQPSTTVLNVYPSADALPENLLKFYVHFTAPMSRGQIYDHIHLLDESGTPVELPFLEIDEELWNLEMTRLTLFIDPGRIKRGVKPLEDIGPALETGRSFTLVIDDSWKDARNQLLVAKFKKTFRVEAPDRTPPDPVLWNINAPRPGSREALQVEFSEPMDHALALRLILVADGQGNWIEGEPGLVDQERRWVFVPAAAWQAGTYQLVVRTAIEDLAGNKVGKPFEVDVFEKVERGPGSQSVRLSFSVK